MSRGLIESLQKCQQNVPQMGDEKDITRIQVRAVVEALETRFGSSHLGSGEKTEPNSRVSLIEQIDLLDGQLKITLKAPGGEVDGDAVDNTLNVPWLKKSLASQKGNSRISP